MMQERLELLDGYLKSGISPILLEDISKNIIDGAIILEADCDISNLNGHYDNMNFVPPKWYLDLIRQSEMGRPILVINKINMLPLGEQIKFMEILKYKKVSTFDLPKQCVIILTCSNLKEKPLCEDIYSLVAHI